MGEDLDSEFLLNKSIPSTKKIVLSVACQFYDPNNLPPPFMVTIRMLFSGICRDKSCSIQNPLYADRADRFKSAVSEILGTSALSFFRQIVFKILGNYILFFDGSLQGYETCIYVESLNQFNLLVSLAKIMEKASSSDPQSEIASAVLAVKMERKITPHYLNPCSLAIQKLYSR